MEKSKNFIRRDREKFPVQLLPGLHTTDESKSLHGQSEPVQAQYYPSHTIASIQDSHSAKQSRVKTQVQNKVHSATINQSEKYGRGGRLI